MTVIQQIVSISKYTYIDASLEFSRIDAGNSPLKPLFFIPLFSATYLWEILVIIVY